MKSRVFNRVKIQTHQSFNKFVLEGLHVMFMFKDVFSAESCRNNVILKNELLPTSARIGWDYYLVKAHPLLTLSVRAGLIAGGIFGPPQLVDTTHYNTPSSRQR